MSMHHYTFQEVSIKGVKRFVGEDGKKKTRTMKFCQTLNPFNKNADGSVKNRDQIMVEITKERDDWMKEVEVKAV